MPKRFGIVNNCSSPIASERGKLCESFWGMVSSIRDKSLIQNTENFDVVRIKKKPFKNFENVDLLPYSKNNIGGHLAIAKPYDDNFTWFSVLTSQDTREEKIHALRFMSTYISEIPYRTVFDKNLNLNLTGEALEALLDGLITAGEIKMGGQGLTMPQLMSNEYLVCKSMFIEEVRQYLLLKHVNLSGYCLHPATCDNALAYHQYLFEKLKFLEETGSRNLPGSVGSSLILDEILEKRDVFSSCNPMLEK